MRWILYQALMAALLAGAAPLLLMLRGRHYLPTLPGRLGYMPEGPAGGLWIHAVSVGEVVVAATLAKALPQDVQLVVTTVTPTGHRRARALFSERVTVAYLPFDFAVLVRRFFNRYVPAALVLVEGDYWPMVLRIAVRRGVPVVVVNGRVSERSFARLHWIRSRSSNALQQYFGPVRRFGVQTPEDGERLAALGVEADRITVTGNLKFESPEPSLAPELETVMIATAAGRPILLAGSTMRGEEEAVLDAFEQLGGGERAFLVLAPRHPERWSSVERLVKERGFRVRRRTASGGDRSDVLLLDSLGELAGLYRLAAAAFVGGTLVPTGGHNPLEPARFAIPVVVGPSMDNFREMDECFTAAGAWIKVEDAEGLAAAWSEWLDDPAAAAAVGRRGRSLVEANRGALQRTLEMLAPILPRRPDGG